MWCCPGCQRSAQFSDPRHVFPAGWTCSACGFRIAHRSGIPCLNVDAVDGADGFDPRLFDVLVRFEESSFWFVNRARLIVALLQEYFPRAASMLEIGCGTGSVLLAIRAALPTLELTGSELFFEGLQFAGRRLGSDASLLQMDAKFIPASDEFDIIGAFDVLEHVKEDGRVIAQIHAALKPGGGAIIAVPQHPWLWSPADDAACHQRRYIRNELETKLQSAGFEILRSTSFNSLLLPAMFASRIVMMAKARLGRAFNPLSELQAAGWLNRVLSAVLRLELAFTARGVRWPIGGSRFVVARKPLKEQFPAASIH